MLKFGITCAVIALSLCVVVGDIAEGDDICPPKVAPDGLDFYLPCTPMPVVHWALVDQIYFDSRSTKLNADARGILDKQAAYLLANPELKIDLVGFADIREAPTSIEKMELGGNRAAAVHDYLIERGVDSARIGVEGSKQIPLIPKRIDEPTLALMRFVYAKEQGS